MMVVVLSVCSEATSFGVAPSVVSYPGDPSPMTTAPTDEVRIGILGTATVATYAMIAPARAVAGVTVASVGSRDEARARAYAGAHGIPGWGYYEELLADPSLDAIYVALPNNLHAEWSLRALAAGKGGGGGEA